MDAFDLVFGNRLLPSFLIVVQRDVEEDDRLLGHLCFDFLYIGQIADTRPHQLVQKSMNTAFPLNWFSDTGWPSRSSSVKSGAGYPGCRTSALANVALDSFDVVGIAVVRVGRCAMFVW